MHRCIRLYIVPCNATAEQQRVTRCLMLKALQLASGSPRNFRKTGTRILAQVRGPECPIHTYIIVGNDWTKKTEVLRPRWPAS